MRLSNIIKQSYKNVWLYKRDYLKASLLFQLMRLIIISPILAFFIQRILRLTSFGGITNTTLSALLKTPTALLFIALIVVIFLFFIFFEFGLYFMYADGHGIKQLKFRNSLIHLLKKLKYFISFQVLLFLIYFILILPIASIGLEGRLIDRLYIPHFITDELMKFPSLKVLYFIALALLFYISIRLIFSIPFFIFNINSTIFSGIKQSYLFSKQQFLKIIGVLAGILFSHSLLTSVLVLLLSTPVMLAENVQFVGAPIIAAIVMSLLQVLTFISFSALQALFAEGIVLLMKERQPVVTYQNNRQPLSRNVKIILVIPMILVAIVSIASNYFYLNQTVYTPHSLIISHRGVTTNAIENTVPALIKAQSQGADMIEVDIQRTKDGEYVLFHDTTLRRLAGISSRISDLTLDEIQQLTLKTAGQTGTIPTLADVLQMANDKGMVYLLEPKFNDDKAGNNVADFLNLLAQYDPLHRHHVHGLNQALIETVEVTTPMIKTGLIIALQFGNLPKTTADFFVVEEFSFNEKTLAAAHQRNKELYIWTINQEPLMKRYLIQGADGLITSYPATARKVKQKITDNFTLTERIRKALNL